MKSTAPTRSKKVEFIPETIFIDESAADHPMTLETINRFPNVPVQRNTTYDEAVVIIQKTSNDVFGAGKRKLALTRFKGSFLKKCPGIRRTNCFWYFPDCIF